MSGGAVHLDAILLLPLLLFLQQRTIPILVDHLLESSRRILSVHQLSRLLTPNDEIFSPWQHLNEVSKWLKRCRGVLSKRVLLRLSRTQPPPRPGGRHRVGQSLGPVPCYLSKLDSRPRPGNCSQHMFYYYITRLH